LDLIYDKIKKILPLFTTKYHFVNKFLHFNNQRVSYKHRKIAENNGNNDFLELEQSQIKW
jgi:hypothetical protein